MMQSQLDRTRAETNAIRDAREKVERVLEGLGSLKLEDDRANGQANKARWSHDDEVWGTLPEEQT
jgi:mediator of RNA polymerase II transcription subunit 7